VGRPLQIDRQSVLEAGLLLADENGLAGVTMQSVADMLGVTPMALYWHFRSKEELIAGLADRIWGEIRTDADPAADWAVQLRHMLESLIDVLRSHSSASTLLMSSEKLGPSHWQATEKTLEILRTAGFDPEHASEIAKSALWTGLTLVMSEPGFNDAGLTGPERAEIQRRKQVELASLPRDRYPRLVEAAVPMTSCDDGPDFHYRFGIDLFIAGVKALAPPVR